MRAPFSLYLHSYAPFCVGLSQMKPGEVCGCHVIKLEGKLVDVQVGESKLEACFSPFTLPVLQT